MVQIIYWTKEGRAYIFAEAIIRTFKTTVRFLLPDNTVINISKKDIISIEQLD